MAITGQLEEGNNRKHGKNQELMLNVEWVEQLMGLPVGWTDLGSWGTE